MDAQMKWIPVIVLGLLIAILFGYQKHLENQFRRHWHYSPNLIDVQLNTPRLADNPGYHLTKPKPRQIESPGYVYWSYVCGR